MVAVEFDGRAKRGLWWVMNCPECGTKAPSGSRFCPNCGARIDRDVPSAAPTMRAQPQRPAPTAAPPQGSTRASTSSGPQVLTLLGGLAAAAGCVLPWVRGGGYVELGVEFTEGILILILGILIAALSIYSMVSRARWPRSIVVLAALGSLVLVGLIVIDIFRAAEQWQANPVDFVGLGIVVALLGSLLATAGAFRSLRRR